MDCDVIVPDTSVIGGVGVPVIMALGRVPTPPRKSWIFFLENSRTWKVLEKYP